MARARRPSAGPHTARGGGVGWPQA
jgi:hypothetical protein